MQYTKRPWLAARKSSVRSENPVSVNSSVDGCTTTLSESALILRGTLCLPGSMLRDIYVCYTVTHSDSGCQCT